MNIAEKITRAKADYDEVYEAGQKSEYDRFWDSCQANGNKKNYNGAFGSAWNDDNFKPKYDIKATSANTMFENSNITDLKAALEKAGVLLDFSTVANGRLVQIFQESQITRVGVVDVTGSAAFKINYMFYNSPNLREIEKWVITDNGNQQFGASTTFDGCIALEEIRIQGTLGCSLSFQWCPLSHDSLMSIIGSLKDYSTNTSGTSHKLTIGSNNYAKLTNAEIEIAENKGWEVV